MKKIKIKSKINRCAQITGTVFIYVLAAMLFALIILYGYKAIGSFIESSGEVELVEMKNTLRSSIKSVASSADVKKKVITVPIKFKRVCFIEEYDSDYDPAVVSTGDIIRVCDDSNLSQFHPIACDAWQSKNFTQNVFLDPVGPLEIDVGQIQLPGHSLCVPVNEGGNIILRLQGKGDRTFIKPWKI